MTVLVLVLSSHVGVYSELHEAQRRTWDSIGVPGVTTRYYFAETWENYTPLKEALAVIIAGEFTHVFRTNSSSYIDKRMLLAFSQTLPIKNCYVGVHGWLPDVPFNGTRRRVHYVSGAGAFLSMDAVSVLQGALNKPIEIAGEAEDVFIGAALNDAGVFPLEDAGEQRYIYYDKPDCHRVELPDVYHYYCKGGLPDGTRLDPIAFDRIHAMKLAKAR